MYQKKKKDNNNKKILYIHRKQFGYHTVSYYFCKYLDNLDITFICFDSANEKLQLPNVNCLYVPNKDIILVRFLRFLYACIKETYKNKYDSIFLVHFPGAFLIRLINPFKRIIFDIRTSDISKNKYKRYFLNLLLRLDTIAFNEITVISKSLAKKLNISENKYSVLPQGSEKIDINFKKFKNELHLIYVGTFNGRELYKTIKGFKIFHDKYKDSIEMSYTIIGSGNDTETAKLQNEINKNDLNAIIFLPGYIHKENLNTYLSKSNLGVAFVPITDYYNAQPVTKIFDFVLAGLPVIATKTDENLKIVNDDNGILINDNETDFLKGLEYFINHRKKFQDKMKIQYTLNKYEWKSITKYIFLKKITMKK